MFVATLPLRLLTPVSILTHKKVQKTHKLLFNLDSYEGRTESHEQLFFACELGTADEGECGGGWNQLLCYP